MIAAEFKSNMHLKCWTTIVENLQEMFDSLHTKIFVRKRI